MATLVNGAAWGTWSGRTRLAYLNGDVSRSGNTIWLTNLSLYFVMQSGTGWGSGSETVSIRDGGCGGGSISDTGVNWSIGGSTSNTVGLNNGGLAVGDGDTSHTFYLTAPGGDCASFTVYFSDNYTSPSEPVVTIVSKTDRGATFSVSISSYGNPCCNNGRWIEAGIAGQNGWTFPLRSAIAQNTTSANIVVDNNSTQSTTLTIQSNTQYYYGGYATNTVRSASKIAGQFWTLPSAPVGSSFETTGSTTATFNLTETSVGTGRTVQLQYRYKKSTDADSSYSNWTNAGSAGNNHTVAVNLTGLTGGVDYDVQVRSSASGGDYSSVNTYSAAFTTNPAAVEITITNISYEYDGTDPTNKAKTTFAYTISAAAGSSDTYDIDYHIIGASGSIGAVLSSQTASGTFSVNLEAGKPYAIEAAAKVTGTSTYGDYTTQYFTTDNFLPYAPKITNLHYEDLPKVGRRQLGLRYEPGLGSGTIQKTYIKIYIYDEANDNWVLYSNDNYNQGSGGVSYGITINPKIYPKTKVEVYQIDSNNIQSPTSYIIFKSQPCIWGKLWRGTTKMNIVGVRIKDTSGNLNTQSNYSQPILVK